MRLMTKNSKSIIIYGILLLLFNQIPTFMLMNKGKVGLLLYICLLFIIALTVLRGVVIGLVTSLVFIFITGSTLLYLGIVKETSLTNNDITMQLFFVYGISLLLLILFTGKIHEAIKSQDNEMRKLKVDIERFIAIDVDTGFDNETRMRVTVNEEMRRTDRYGGEFVFISISIENYDKFEQLYGANEVQHLWKELARKITKNLRLTDKKFRYGISRIGLLLPNTSDQYIDTIYEKLSTTLKDHQLLSKRMVSLRYKTSYFLYTPQLTQTFDEFLVDLEREMKINDL